MIDWHQIIPVGTGTAVAGAVIPIVLAWLAHHSKRIKFRIVFGEENKNGKTLVTADMLKANCENRQSVLDKSLFQIIEGQKEHQRQLNEVEKKIAFIEGKVSMRRG